MTSEKIKIDITSDFACPWCLVGIRRLREAIEQRSELGIEVNWLPFQLNPDMPRKGRNRRDYYRDKFGDARAKNLREALNKAGEETGIVFCDEQDAVAPNTLSAHVLMYWASQNEEIDTNCIAEKLFVAHHIACEDIGDKNILARIAGESGLNSKAVAASIAAGKDEDTVREKIAQNEASGRSGVPFFVINETYGVSGAQPTATFVSILDRFVLDRVQS